MNQELILRCADNETPVLPLQDSGLQDPYSVVNECLANTSLV